MNGGNTIQSIAKLVIKKPPELEDLGNCQYIHTVELEIICSGGSTKGVTGQTLAGGIRCVIHGSKNSLSRNTASLN